MKFLLDENVPKSIHTEMLKRGYDVTHILFLIKRFNRQGDN